MKKGKSILILIFFFLFSILIIQPKVEGANNLVAIKVHGTNSDLKYRNSTETVMRLAEYNYPTSQLRAVWVTPLTGDISSYKSESAFKQELNEVLDNMEKWGMNTLVFHVRTHNNAMYRSELNPLASYFKGVDFDVFDPLAWLIDECHSRGIEFHAWLNPYRVSTTGNINQSKAEDLPAVNPANDPENLLQVNSSIILDPGIPLVREFLVDTCMELIENYDVDAINFDDYFYISGADDAATRAKYNTENLSLENFRRASVNSFIEALSKSIRAYNTANNKAVQLGIAPSGIYRNGGYVASPTYDANGNLTSPTYSDTSGMEHYGNYLYADTLNWINNEWIDYIMPQLYWAIEHTTASYAALTRWWSWAVKNKKVNFYAGLGIYMAIDSGSSAQYWQYNDNEIELQLLNGGQYEEFGGACFYRYGSLISGYNNHPVITNAIDLISNDYWQKRVPGAVSKYYAPLIPEIAPTNVIYDSATNLLSFDEVKDCRGYMIYKVPKGQILDKNNIDHVYQYIQTNQITIDDVASYDYYVASVNKANETSEAVALTAKMTYKDVILAIDNLPEVITYENKEQVEQVRKLYDSLPEEEKVQVTNYLKLTEAEAIIIKYEALQDTLTNYIKTLDLHIKTSRKIDLPTNMSLQYKDASDQALYNIETGEKLKNYLAVKEICLIISITEDNLTVSQEIMVNIGYTSKTQQALFYRNDPSSMSPDDEGAYGASHSSYIGWSGHTLVVEDVILYIARTNYFEITDSSNIEPCHFSSVAGVYVNKTSSPLTLKMTDAFEKNSSNNDGYIVIGKNEVKEVSHGFDANKTITLEKDDTLIIFRYLDGSITNNPLVPVTKIKVGTKAYIDEEVELNDEEKVQAVIELINTIPADITLETESLLNQIKEVYDALDESLKPLVTNSQKLTDALDKLAKLKTELANKKQEAISAIQNHLDLDNYSPASQQQINNICASAAIKINNATSLEEVERIFNDTMNQLDQIVSKEDELIAYRQQIINRLNEMYDLELYSPENQDIINNYLQEAIFGINMARSTAEVDDIFEIVTDQIDKVLTIAEEEAAFNQLKESYIKKVDDLVASFTDATPAEKAELQAMGERFKTQINNATTESDVKYVWTRAEDTIKSYFDNLAKAKTEACNEIDTYISELKYTPKELEVITEMATNKKGEINNLASIEEIKAIPNLFIDEINTYHASLEQAKLSASASLDPLIQSWYTDAQKAHIQTIIDDTKANILLAGSIDEVTTLKTDAMTLVNQYITELEEAINNAKSYFDSKADNTKTEITRLIYQYKLLLNDAETVSDVEKLIQEFDQEYNDITTDSLEQVKNDAKEELDEYIESLSYSAKEKAEIKKQKATIDQQIDQAKKRSEIEELKNNFIDEVEANHQALQTAIAQAKDTLETFEAKNQNAQDYIEKVAKDLDDAATKAEVDQIMASVSEELEKLNNPSSCINCACDNLTIIYLAIFAFALSAVVMFRKKH